jgi:hypothetical protein
MVRKFHRNVTRMVEHYHKFNFKLKEIKMLDQNLDDKIIELRRMSAEHYQKAAWNQLLALDNYRESNFEAAERFAQLSFEDQMNAMEYAELADAEFSLHLDLELEE